MDLGLHERVALVTGGYRGIGAGIVRALAREGATVVVHGFEPGQPDDLVAELTGQGLAAHAIAGDLLDDDGADVVVAAALAAAGRVDVLVNNYGLAVGDEWFDTPVTGWIEAYERNVLSGVRLVQRLVPAMVDRGWGRVVLLGTVGSTRPGATRPGYYAAKGALVTTAVGLAKALVGSGVTVNTVSPGIIATDEVRAMVTARAAERGLPTDWASVQRMATTDFLPNPTERLGTVEEVGDLVAFVASDRAGYVNGANLRIDGGAADTVN